MFKLYTFLSKHKTAGILCLLVFLSIVGFLASRIHLEEDITSLIPAGEKQDILKKVLKQSELTDKIIVTISSEDDNHQEELTQYAEDFIEAVNSEIPEFVNEIHGKVPDEGIREVYDFVYNNLPLFLTAKDYQRIDSRMSQDSIPQYLENDYKILLSPSGLVTKEYLFKDPMSLTMLGLNKLQELQLGDDFELYNNFLLTKDLKHLLLFVSPTLPSSETYQNAEFLKKLDKIQEKLNKKYPDLQSSYFGGVSYAVANANQIKQDIQITMSVAVSILLLLLIFYYRKLYVPLLLFLPSIIGGMTAIAFLYILKGTISAISVGIGAILLGISIDYALHILTHYKKNRDTQQLYKEVTTPVLMSSGTTAIAFLCLLFIKSPALNDLGIFAAISVMVASIFALILIPQLYKFKAADDEESHTFLDRFASYDFHKNKFLILFMTALFVGGIFFFTQVKFNNDLSAINYEPKNIKQTELKVQEIAGRAAKSIYLVSYGNTVDEALEKNNRLYTELNSLQNAQKIKNYSSIGGVVLSTNTQLAKIEAWNTFWTPQKKEFLENQLIENSDKFGFKPETFNTFYNLLQKDFEPIDLQDYHDASTLYLDDYISYEDNFATVTSSIDVPDENLEEVISLFEKSKNVVVVDRKQINQNFLGNLRNSFNKLIWYSIIAVFLVLLFSYRSIILSILTIIPIGITWIIALGIMAVLNIEFNILNIIISTFIFGLGLDYSIFVTNAFLKEYELGVKVIKTYRISILLSVITTLLGIGALFFAKHPALRSISMVSIIGVISAVSVAFVLQGFIFDSLFLQKTDNGKPAFNLNKYFISATRYKSDPLYFKKAVFDNYRYKSVFQEVKSEFHRNKERYLKLADYLQENENILHLYTGCGVLPIYLHYKKPSLNIFGFDPGEKNIIIASHCFAANSENLNFGDQLPQNLEEFQVLILSEEPNPEVEKIMVDQLKRYAREVVILKKDYNYRWIIDLNFEISYRQNDVVVLQKLT